ncbi:MAG: right-handed parallel beta-helix repeat-containing protein [Isosphaeraceae bacterium]
MRLSPLPCLTFAALLVVSGFPTSSDAREPASGLEFHVATDGDDANPGTDSKPFATLERARDAIRLLKKDKGLPTGGVTVNLHPGLYERSQPFVLTAEDSGTEASLIVYRGRQGAEVRISGGKRIKDWKLVTDPEIIKRLDPEARGQVMQTDLRAQGVTDFGKIGGGFGLRGGPGLELFFNDTPMTLSRYPNDGFIKITSVEGPTKTKDGRGRVEGEFTYEGDRPERWTNEPDAWVLGYWFHDWAEQRQRIESIDVATKRMTLAKPYHGYGYRKGQWFYGFNLLSEIDQPGEWHLDRKAGLLYFWPPSAIDQAQTTVSVLDNLVTLDNAHNVTLRGLTFEASRGTAIIIERAANNQVVGCTIRNVGGTAVTIQGVNSGVQGCDITATGDGGVSLRGGDRKTLTPAKLFAENNHIHHWSRWNRMNRHGIALSGVGNRASHNLINHSPHSAIHFGGNDHLIEFNEIHNVCNESRDAGAIYAGRDWTGRGTIIRHNYMHHIDGLQGRGCIGIYLDDMYCGTSIFGNLFYKVTMAAYIGGGHDNHIENNIFKDCKPAVHVDSRALGWAAYHADTWVNDARENGTMSGIRFDQPQYSERYPTLPKILENDPYAPTGSLIARNVFQGGVWSDVDKKAQPFVEFQDNLLDADPRFVDPEHGNFQLRNDSPAFALGFQRIPIEQIGLRNDDSRVSWPVSHEVSPRPKP